MKITVQLPEELLRRARRRAMAEGRTLTSLVEEGLVRVLDQAAASVSGQVVLPVSRARGGLRPGVQLCNSRSLADRMDDREPA